MKASTAALPGTSDHRQRLRFKTWVEQDGDEWYCVAGLFVGAGPETVGDDDTASDHAVRVGPFPSRQVARRELRGDFRKVVMGAFAEFMRANGGQVLAAEFGG